MIPAPLQERIPALQAERAKLAAEAAREADPEIRRLIEQQDELLLVMIWKRAN
ncbi:hypothetical protein [Aquibium sp. ELW1220]|uniref:hypothetical protein n=1 Tax=Aquibium sp. ELW1220 TaxID=2976766 RepID=UPI0025AFCF90|nr:hypothetical protein [Aquibium sp. ELW1220]MDN2581640.1 hypothetical protein [Aquibium sp. ELW1220]